MPINEGREAWNNNTVSRELIPKPVMDAYVIEPIIPAAPVPELHAVITFLNIKPQFMSLRKVNRFLGFSSCKKITCWTVLNRTKVLPLRFPAPMMCKLRQLLPNIFLLNWQSAKDSQHLVQWQEPCENWNCTKTKKNTFSLQSIELQTRSHFCK